MRERTKEEAFQDTPKTEESRRMASNPYAGGRESWLGPLLWTALLVLIISVLILSCVPPVSRDALIHHLAIPKLYLKHGGMFQIPQLPYSYYPMNLDLLYLISLYLKNDIAPKWIHFSFALLTGVLLFRYLRKTVGTTYGLFAVIFFLSTPVIVRLSITAYVDLGLVFFSTASLMVLLRWLDDGGRMWHLVLSGIFCGLAMGTKYNGIVPFVVLSLFVPYLSSRSLSPVPGRTVKAISSTAVFALTALVVFSPWMIRNYVWTGNPIYPLYDSWFNDPIHHAGSPIGTFAFRSLVHGESWLEIALLPLRVFFQGQDGNPKYFDGKMNPFLLILPVMAFFSSSNLSSLRKRELKIFGFFSALLLLITLFSSEMRIRYITPIIPPLAILSVFGCRNFLEWTEKLKERAARVSGKSLVLLCVGLALLWNGAYVFQQYRIVDPIPYLRGRVSRDAYIERFRPEYPVLVFANKNLPSDARILFLFLGERGYYCDREYLLDMRDKRSLIQGLVKNGRGPDDVWAGLREKGITHLLINLAIFDRWAKESFTREEMAILRSFFGERTKTLRIHKDYGLFVLG